MSLSSLLNIKIESHRIILNTIRQYKEISAAQLSRITKYRRSTLVYILRNLRRQGLIEISRIGEATSVGGKPPTLWRLVPDRGYIIGLEIVPAKIRTTIVDFSSNVLYQNIDTLKKNIRTVEDISLISEFVRDKITEMNLAEDKIIGIGTAFPGLVDRKKGIIYYSDSFGIKNLEIRDTLQGELGIPVRIANDANSGVLGLKWYQNEKLPPNTVFLSINEAYTGIGAGLILNNRLYEGSSGTAGEIVPFLPDIGLLLEKGIKKFGKEALKLDAKDREKVTVAEIAESAQKGCKVSVFILENISQVVVREIIRIIELINPDLIVIGGDFSSARFIVNDYIKPHVEKECRDFFPLGITIPKIIFSDFGIYSVSIGATALILEELFS